MNWNYIIDSTFHDTLKVGGFILALFLSKFFVQYSRSKFRKPATLLDKIFISIEYLLGLIVVAFLLCSKEDEEGVSHFGGYTYFLRIFLFFLIPSIIGLWMGFVKDAKLTLGERWEIQKKLDA